MKKHYVEKGKLKWLEEFYSIGLSCFDEIDAKSYDNATILPIKPEYHHGRYMGKGGVIDAGGHYIENSYISYGFGGGYVVKECDYIDKKVVYCGSDHNAWGHFLVDVVPRLWLSLEDNLNKYSFVIVRNELSNEDFLDNEYDFLCLLGIEKRTFIINRPVRFKTVIVPERSYDLDYSENGKSSRIHAYYLKIYKKVIERALSEGKDLENNIKRIFFTRSGLSVNHWHDSGIEIIDSFFENNGYTIICPEKMRLRDFIVLLYNAEEVAYVSGTLQHNMLFAPEGKKAICLERKPMLVRYQTDIDLLKKIDVTYVSGTYSLWPGNVSISTMYAWTEKLNSFQNDSGWKLPDCNYLKQEYLAKNFDRYLSEFECCDEWDTIQGMEHYFEIIGENREEIGEVLGLDVSSPEMLRDKEKIRNDLSKTLLKRHTPYCRWKDGESLQFFTTATSIIDSCLKAGKENFLIFPYGNLGMLFTLVLKERYGITPKKIFDNKVSNWRSNVLKIKGIKKFLDDTTVVILTTRSKDCLLELSKHVDMKDVISPYTVI